MKNIYSTASCIDLIEKKFPNMEKKWTGINDIWIIFISFYTTRMEYGNF